MNISEIILEVSGMYKKLDNKLFAHKIRYHFIAYSRLDCSRCKCSKSGFAIGIYISIEFSSLFLIHQSRCISFFVKNEIAKEISDLCKMSRRQPYHNFSGGYVNDTFLHAHFRYKTWPSCARHWNLSCIYICFAINRQWNSLLWNRFAMPCWFFFRHFPIAFASQRRNAVTSLKSDTKIVIRSQVYMPQLFWTELEKVFPFACNRLLE